MNTDEQLPQHLSLLFGYTPPFPIAHVTTQVINKEMAKQPNGRPKLNKGNTPSSKLGHVVPNLYKALEKNRRRRDAIKERIVDFLSQNPWTLQQKVISKFSEVSDETISLYLRDLQKIGVLEFKMQGRFRAWNTIESKKI